jgi:hypothetical protein
LGGGSVFTTIVVHVHFHQYPFFLITTYERAYDDPFLHAKKRKIIKLKKQTNKQQQQQQKNKKQQKTNTTNDTIYLSLFSI